LVHRKGVLNPLIYQRIQDTPTEQTESSLFSHQSFEFGCIILEEVHIQQLRYLHQDSGVQCGLLEYHIYIGPAAVQFPCHPGNGVPLVPQFLSNDLTDMYHIPIICAEDFPHPAYI